MREKIKTIQESLFILEEENDRLEKKEAKTSEDLKDLKAIKLLRKELIKKLDDTINEPEPIIENNGQELKISHILNIINKEIDKHEVC